MTVSLLLSYLSNAFLGFAIKNNLLGSVIPPSEGTERLLKLQLQTSAGLVSLISAYAPTLTSASELKDRFYDDLSAAISKVPPQTSTFTGISFNCLTLFSYKNFIDERVFN